MDIKRKESSVFITKFITAATDFLELFSGGYKLLIDEFLRYIDDISISAAIEPNQENTILEHIKNYFHLCKYCEAKFKNLHYGLDSQLIESGDGTFLYDIGDFKRNNEMGEVPTRWSKMSYFAIIYLIKKNKLSKDIFLEHKVNEIADEMLEQMELTEFDNFDNKSNNLFVINRVSFNSISVKLNIIDNSKTILTTKLITYSLDHIKKIKEM
jgi:hypothetical protein